MYRPPRWRSEQRWASGGVAYTGRRLPRVVRWPLAGFGTAEPERGGPPGSLAITPDLSKVVYVGNNRTQVFVRPFDDLAPVAIASGGLLRGLFVSPDGQWVGFIDNAVTLKKVAITGGPAVVLTRLTGAPRGATWLHDDTIVFATLGSPALQRVSAVGGTPTVLVEPDTAAGEVAYGWPQALPGGRSVLFTVVTEQGGFDTYRGRGGLLEAGSIAILDVETMTRKVLVRGGNLGKYVRSGHLVYVAAGAFWAAPFDLGRLELTGPAIPVLPKAGAAEARVEDFAIAVDGTLVYRENTTGTGMRTLVWVDRAGMETAIAAPPRAYEYPAISPDGTKIAVAILDQENDIWMWDLRRERLTRATFDSRGDTLPVWTPDGARLVFASQRESGNYNLWWQAADGSGTAERLTRSSVSQFPTGISPDGTRVLFWETMAASGRDVLAVSLEGKRHISTLVQTPFEDRDAIISPDGRWLAYYSDSSGRFEIYVRPFPDTGAGLWQVSTEGGTQPLWARSGRELFYLGADGTLMRVPVEATGRMWSAGAPEVMSRERYFFEGTPVGRTYDVSPDGQRFLRIKVPPSPARTVVVQHWDRELARRVPIHD